MSMMGSLRLSFHFPPFFFLSQNNILIIAAATI